MKICLKGHIMRQFKVIGKTHGLNGVNMMNHHFRISGNSLTTYRIAFVAHGQIKNRHGDGLGLIETEAKPKPHSEPELTVLWIGTEGAHRFAGSNL